MQVQQSSVPLFFVSVCPTKIYERPRRFTHGGHPHSPRADGRATAAAMTWTPRRVPPSRQLQLQGWSLQRPQSECPQLCCCGHPLEGQQHSVGTLRGCCSGNGAARPPVLGGVTGTLRGWRAECVSLPHGLIPQRAATSRTEKFNPKHVLQAGWCPPIGRRGAPVGPRDARLQSGQRPPQRIRVSERDNERDEASATPPRRRSLWLSPSSRAATRGRMRCFSPRAG